MKIKLLGRAIREPEGKVCAFVAPHLVPDESPLANVEDVFNAISVKGDAIGDVMFYGRGAGKLPTASAVVADVMDAAKHLKTKKYISWGPEGGPDAVYSIDEVKNRWYVRTKVDTDRSGLRAHRPLNPGRQGLLRLYHRPEALSEKELRTAERHGDPGRLPGARLVICVPVRNEQRRACSATRDSLVYLEGEVIWD